MALSSKHQQFINEYLSCFNATEAYRRVYTTASDETAQRNSSVLLRNTEVADEIKRRLTEKAMGADEALLRLAEQARAEYAEYILEDGSVDLASMKADGKMHLIKGIKPTKFGREVIFHDAQTALVHIGRHHKLFTDKVDVSGELEVKENESATERILSRIDGLAARLRAQSSVAGNSTNGEGSEGA